VGISRVKIFSNKRQNLNWSPFNSGGPTLSIHIGMILDFVGFVTMREIITSKSTRNSNQGTCTNATK
jgi:hypothetical protein